MPPSIAGSPTRCYVYSVTSPNGRVWSVTPPWDIFSPDVAAMADTYNSGERAPYSGQVEIVGPRGGRTGEERTVVQGEPLPPTREAGQRFVYVDRTRNGAGTGKGRK